MYRSLLNVNGRDRRMLLKFKNNKMKGIQCFFSMKELNDYLSKQNYVQS